MSDSSNLEIWQFILSIRKRVEELEDSEIKIRERNIDLSKMIEKLSDNTFHIYKELLKIKRNK